METIHFKTVDPVSQELLRGASQKGLSLNWERYEKQQPQDGFLRLGLSCPYGCMQGPCRIDPYGRGADKGICGLDRDGMAAAFLLRLALQGVLETMESCPDGKCDAEVVWPAPLDKTAAAALSALGGAPLSTREVLASAAMLVRPSATPAALVRQALRLGLIGIAVAEQGAPKDPAASRGCRAGYGLLAKDTLRIGVAGKIPETLVQSLLKAAPEACVSLGDWIPAGESFLPIACTSAEAETVLSSGRINLLLAGPGTDPGLMALCGTLKIPVVQTADRPEAAAVLAQARTAFEGRGSSSFAPDASLIGEGRVAIGAGAVEKALTAAKIVLLGGADTLFQSLGHLPVELAKGLIGETHAVASWNDAAIWMVKQDLPVGILDAGEGPLAAVRALAKAGKLSALKGICFTGLKASREFTLALGLAALGIKVAIAVPLPLWGSETVRTALKETLAAAGGTLAHFDHPAQADELLELFIKG